MKKTFLILSMGLFMSTIYSSCSKDQQLTDNSKDVVVSQRTKQDVLNEIEQLTNTINKSKKHNQPLGWIQDAVGYATADAAGATMGFKATAWAAGPAYGAAFGFLGAVAGSAYHYIDNHYDFKQIEPPIEPDGSSPDGTNGYSDSYEKFGYVHNLEILKMYDVTQTRPTSPQDFLDQYYDIYCQDIANEFNLDLVTLKSIAPKSEFVAQLQNYPTLQLPIDFKNNSLNLGVDAVVVNTTYDFFVDVENPNISTKEEVFQYVTLYLDLVDLDNTLTNDQKDQLKYILNVFKYSYSLWTYNI